MINKDMRKIADMMFGILNSYSDETLLQLSEDCDKLNSTNCWWVEYGLKDIVKQVCINELQIRKDRKTQND
jgi:hypothetical protein